MRTIWLAGMALALSACGSGGGDTANDANALTTDNLLMEDNLMLDSNSLNGATGLDANGSLDAGTANLMEKDAATNDPDTNLANGL